MSDDNAPHQLPAAILRAYDIRGVVGSELTEGVFYSIGRAFASEMAARGARTVAVGYDGRVSSPMLEAALVRGLTASGADVLRIGCGPSPMLYFATYARHTDAGLMITGSHNPPDFNGLKMTVGGGAFFGEDIQGLGQRVADGDFIDAAGTSTKGDVFEDYVARLAADYIGETPLTVAWDPGNGASGAVVQALTDRLPGRHIVINGEIDGTFPAHHPDPTVEENLAQLRDVVAAEGCDLGIGFDGDGDRIGIVDHRGHVMWGDQLLVMLAREVLKDHPGAPILCDVKASRVFFDEIRRLGGEPVMWKAGHSHIKSKMAELGAPLAGEMSAHIFFKHRYYGFDDATYAAVRLLSILASGPERLADFLDSLPKMHNTPEIRFACPDDRKFTVVDEVLARLRAEPGTDISDMDGMRVEKTDGWWLLRASNTQPMLVVRCESETATGLAALLDEVRGHLGQSGVDTMAF